MSKSSTKDNPARPVDFDSDIESKESKQASLMLKALLGGDHISRLNCHEFNIAMENSSIHSTKSYIENCWDIPISSHRDRDNTRISVYYMKDEDIAAFKSKPEREIQAQQTRYESQTRRFTSSTDSFGRLLDSIDMFPEVLERYPWLEDELTTHRAHITRTLKSHKRRQPTT